MLWFLYFVIRVLVAFICLAIPLMFPGASFWVYVVFWPTAVVILALGLFDPRYLLRRTIAAISTSAVAGFVISGAPPLTEDAIANDTLREVLNLLIALAVNRMTQGDGWPFVFLVGVTLLVLATLEGLRMWEERPKDGGFEARLVPTPASVPVGKNDLLLLLRVTIHNTGTATCTINPQDVRIRVCWLWTIAAVPGLEKENAVLPMRGPVSLELNDTYTMLLSETLHSPPLNWVARRLPRWLTWLLLWGDVEIAGHVFSVRFPASHRDQQQV